jgi:hypothetical protein
MSILYFQCYFIQFLLLNLFTSRQFFKLRQALDSLTKNQGHNFDEIRYSLTARLKKKQLIKLFFQLIHRSFVQNLHDIHKRFTRNLWALHCFEYKISRDLKVYSGQTQCAKLVCFQVHQELTKKYIL